MNRLFAVLAVFATLTLVPPTARLVSAQCSLPPCGGGGGDTVDPTIDMPSGELTSNSSVSVTIGYSDDVEMGPITIELNGYDVTNQFSIIYTSSTTARATSSSLALSSESNTLWTQGCDTAGNCESDAVGYTYDNLDPTINISPGTSTSPDSAHSIAITWGDNLGLDESSTVIKLNGSVITASFDWSRGGTLATSSGTVSLPPGDHSFYAYIEDNSGRGNSKTVTYTRPETYYVAVTPDDGSATTDAGDSDSFTFTVKNTGNSSATYSLSASCSGSAWAPGTTCEPSSASVALAPGATANVSVTYAAAQRGPGLEVQLTASGHGVSDSGSASIRLNR